MTPTSGRCVACLLLLVLALASVASEARWRLLMFDDESCPFCLRWHEEVGAVYGRTREGQLAPLQVTRLADGVPPGVSIRSPVRHTPTFLLLDRDGLEQGRITGYLGEEQFWGLLEALLRGTGR